MGNSFLTPKLPIGGFLKQSLLDYPGRIAAVVFTRGCNFRCIYCHNPELVWPEQIKTACRHDPESILDWIYDNRQLLDAAVITGGEPTIHGSLPEYVLCIKKMGLKVKLDTNGTHPEMLEQLINERMVDYIAMDIKAPLDLPEYRQIAGSRLTLSTLGKIERSIEIIRGSGNIDFEFRTTVLETYHTEESIKEIAGRLSGKLFIQNFNPAPGITSEGLTPLSCFGELKNHDQGTTSIMIRN